MAVSIGISFPGGRFHATPWGHHVNEGVPEWPPSPWRFLRALVAVCKRKLVSQPQAQARLASVIAPLAQSAPQFCLPPATLGHTRHYMPWYKKGPEDKTLVFDTFVCLDPADEVVFHWPEAALSPQAHELLGQLLEGLNYLGRAESWALAGVRTEFNPALLNCSVGSPKDGQDAVRVLVPDPDRWNDWAFSDSRIVPSDPLWNLLAETADMQQERWSDPPGSKWVHYARRADCFAPRPSNRRLTAHHAPSYTVARFAIDVSEGKRPLPAVADTLPLAELTRRALLWQCKRLAIRDDSSLADAAIWRRSPAFWGKDADGRPQLGHQHAFFLPADEDGDGRLEHITVYAPMGFSALECRALDRLRELHLPHREPLRLLLTGLGKPADFRCPLTAPSRTWRSATPFLVTRYPKFRGTKRDRPEDYATPRAFARCVLEQELRRRRELPEVVAVEDVGMIGRQQLRPIQFKRFRGKPGDDGGRRPAGSFRVTFAQPLAGPLCLGHSCHFGLGLFLPSPDVVRETRS